MKLSELIQATNEVCNPNHRPYSTNALELFIAGLSEFPSHVIKDALMWFANNKSEPLTLAALVVRITETMNAAAIQAANDAEKTRRIKPNPTGRTYINRTGDVRPVAELPEMLASLYQSHCCRSKMTGEIPMSYLDWVAEDKQKNLFNAIQENPDIIPAGWEPEVKW